MIASDVRTGKRIETTLQTLPSDQISGNKGIWPVQEGYEDEPSKRD